jgi:DNA-binding MarR family transcriptional regulator
MTKIGLSPGQPKILTYVSEHNCCMQKEIAIALDIEPATVSQLLNNMAQNGLIKRSAPAERKLQNRFQLPKKDKVPIRNGCVSVRKLKKFLCRVLQKKNKNNFWTISVVCIII